MSDNDYDLNEQLAITQDLEAPRDVKLVACDRLVDAGKDAIPILVERLGQLDDPVFLSDAPVSTGPMHTGPPIVREVNLKFQLQTLLYRIICPDPLVDDRKNDSPPDPMTGPDLDAALSPKVLQASRPQLAFVEDWPSWWKQHQSESLEDIRDWSAREVDALWGRIYDQTTPPPQ